MRIATKHDIPRLVEMMTEFYAEADYPLNKRRAEEAFDRLLADEHYGRVWFIEEHTQDAGYVVLTLTFSMEYGGFSAFIDDLYVRKGFRNRGLATAALSQVREFCVKLGVRAIHLEVGKDNAAAQAVYRRVGFASTDRQLLTLKLADPTHVSD